MLTNQLPTTNTWCALAFNIFFQWVTFIILNTNPHLEFDWFVWWSEQWDNRRPGFWGSIRDWLSDLGEVFKCQVSLPS